MCSGTIPVTKTPGIQRRRKSRFGCRNCKLRKVKCDESRPCCVNCQIYGVVCNFGFNVPDFQSLPEERTKKNVLKQFAIPSPQSSMGNCIWVADGATFYMLNAHDQDLFNRFQCRTLHSLGGPEIVEIHNRHMLALSFKRPFLWHGMLAVTAVHDRYLGVTPTHRRSFCETYHWSQCTSLFKKSLGQPIKEEHKDPIWAAASTLGILAFSSINACPLEEAWPLGPPDSSDLEWLRLAAGKMRLWQLVNPLRETSIFAPMADTFTTMHQSLPIEGINGVLAELKQLCMLDETSTAYNNPYFRVAHGLSELLATPVGQATLGKAMKFSTKILGEFKTLIERKDPIALTLLYLWYTRARECRWWIDIRATYEMPAIRTYLQRYYQDWGHVQKLLSRVDIGCL
ncbi:related to C6 finger domain protein [Fusarium fujikuroi]|nr:related to C6 finger domain protein [Fusarium fujikuroi]